MTSSLAFRYDFRALPLFQKLTTVYLNLPYYFNIFLYIFYFDLVRNEVNHDEDNFLGLILHYFAKIKVELAVYNSI